MLLNRYSLSAMGPQLSIKLYSKLYNILGSVGKALSISV